MQLTEWVRFIAGFPRSRPRQIMSTIESNLQAVRARIAAAARAAGREPGDIALLAVSKTFAAGEVRAAYAARTSPAAKVLLTASRAISPGSRPAARAAAAMRALTACKLLSIVDIIWRGRERGKPAMNRTHSVSCILAWRVTQHGAIINGYL